MTAAIESLKREYPHYQLSVKTSCDDIFTHNPRIQHLPQKYKEILMDNKLVHQSHLPYHFMHNYCKEFENHLNIKLDLSVNHPFIYLSEEEKKYKPFIGKYALINAGRKDDYLTKHWGKENFQKLVDLLKNKITFIQIGEKYHYHPPLHGTVNKIGQTTARQLICLAYHSLFGVGPVSFLHHIYAAFEKPYFCIASGFEPVHWEKYHTDILFSSHGQLKCCQKGGCWKGKLTGTDSVCELPVIREKCDPIAECMNMIKPEIVAESILAMMKRDIFSVS